MRDIVYEPRFEREATELVGDVVLDDRIRAIEWTLARTDSFNGYPVVGTTNDGVTRYWKTRARLLGEIIVVFNVKNDNTKVVLLAIRAAVT